MSQVSPLCEDLLRRLLTPDPDQRLSLAAAMAHPWSRAGMPQPLAALNGQLLVRIDSVYSEGLHDFSSNSDMCP